MKILEKKEICAVNAGATSPFVWGSILGVVGYTVSNKFDFRMTGVVVAGIGGGVTAMLDYNPIFQLMNVAAFAEVVSRIQSSRFII